MILDLGLGHVGLGIVEVVLEQGLCLILEAEDEGLGDVLLQELQIDLVERVLEKLQMLPLRVLGEVRLLDHADQRLTDIDGMDGTAVLRESRVEGLHDKARADAEQALPLGIFTKLVRRDLLGSALF